ncbi:N-acetyltransferase [Myroides fluvii]|uniref:N-acetyltransferase n=1 Tax=Myroides fluvii TaxID=2572594 RepID=UPI00131DB084|nr:N-acetyltransferase [Myroides fluvii]
MIRLFKTEDSRAVVDLWYEASILAHDFIDASYWQEKKADMEQIYIPSSETYVYEQEHCIVGFVSLVENYIAAIFVAPNEQGKGIGKELMQFIKQKRSTLELGVYAKNTNSIAFYEKQGFVVVEEKLDESTGEREVVMEYK